MSLVSLARAPIGVLLLAIAYCLTALPTRSQQIIQSGDLTIPHTVVQPNQEIIYFGENWVQNSSTLRIESGADVDINGGEYGVTLKPGFHAKWGSTVDIFNDHNLNGHNDHLENQDSDGDGLYDAFETQTGTNPHLAADKWISDTNGDGIPDEVVDYMQLHSSSGTMFNPAASSHTSNFRIWPEAYGEWGIDYSYYVDFGFDFFDFVGVTPDWLDTPNLGLTYYDYVFDEYWYYDAEYWGAEAGSSYMLQAMLPGYTPGTPSWENVGQQEVEANGSFINFPTPGTFEDIFELPEVLRVIKMGKAGILSGAPGGSKKVSLMIGGSANNGKLSMNIPGVLSVPSASNLDWEDLKIFGNIAPWEIDLNGDGITDVSLDPINQSGKISIPVLGKRIEIEIDSGGGVFASLGSYKVGVTSTGEYVVELPNQISGDSQIRIVISPFVPDAIVDLNRNGVMEFSNADLTAANDPYVFWINDDIDEGHSVDIFDWEEDDLEVGVLDAFDSKVEYKRDLEDLTRVWLDFSKVQEEHDLSDEDIVLEVSILKSEGIPSISLFHSAESDGGREYLMDEAVADQQIQGLYGERLCRVMWEQPQTVPERAWRNLSEDHRAHLLFEGYSEGSGELRFVLKNGSDTIHEFNPIDLKLVDVVELYTTWTAGDVQNAGIIPLQWPFDHALYVSGPELPHATSMNPEPIPLEERDFILFVHGWNVPVWEKQAFASTMFKRLWHQGYKGGFGLFRWPTFHSPDFFELVGTHFNDSEERAWNSGSALSGLIQSISYDYSDEFGSRVRLYAHSMGNVVVSEALRQQSTGDFVHTYVSAQAALSAHAWDNSTPEMGGAYKNGKPNVYGYYWQNGVTSSPHSWEDEARPSYFHSSNMPVSVRYVNHYNPSDWALAFTKWQLNQKRKPELGYGVSANGYTKINGIFSESDLLIPNDIYEIFAHAAPSHSYATGAQENVGGVFMTTLEADLDFEFDFGSPHKGHSAQFRSTIQKRWDYWEELLRDMLIF